MSRRVLVVDDDPRLLHIVAMYLGIEGYDVAMASNPKFEMSVEFG